MAVAETKGDRPWRGGRTMVETKHSRKRLALVGCFFVLAAAAVSLEASPPCSEGAGAAVAGAVGETTCRINLQGSWSGSGPAHCQGFPDGC
jgi:hypothetical protein